MSNQSKSINFAIANNKNDIDLSEKTLHEIQMHLMNKQEIRLRYLKLMNDAQNILGKDEAIDLVKESEVIWEKLRG
tara:strand:+ start:131 stop:358 length:228 start_codon:yes stop_codon:yes gene_type:complete